MATSKNDLLLAAQDVVDAVREALPFQEVPLPMAFVVGDVDGSEPSMIAYGYQDGQVCLKRVHVPACLLSRATA